MDSDGWLRILALVLLTLGAAFCASSEIAFAAMNKIRIQHYADNGDRRAKKALLISEQFEKALTTLLIGNNITHIAFAALVTLFATQIWGVESVKYTTIISTVYVFLVSEMIPKSLAKANSERFVLAVSGPLHLLMRILTPVAFLFMSIGHGVSKLFPEHEEPEITEEEFLGLIETAREEGVLDEDKQQLVHSALSFDKKTAGDICTPSGKIEAVEVHATKEEILKTVRAVKYSRLPVYEDDINHIIGIIHVREFLKYLWKNEEFHLRSLLLDTLTVNQNTFIDDLLQELSSKKIHMAVVADGSGKTLGIITVEDILEELVGDIWDEDDAASDKRLPPILPTAR